MNDKNYNTLMNHRLGTKTFWALLYSVGLPRTSEEEKILADLAQAYAKLSARIAARIQAPKLLAVWHCLNDVYEETQKRTAVAKVMTRFFLERALLMAVVADMTFGSTADAELKRTQACSRAFDEARNDTRTFHEHCRELRLVTLQYAAKHLEEVLNECAEQE